MSQIQADIDQSRHVRSKHGDRSQNIIVFTRSLGNDRINMYGFYLKRRCRMVVLPVLCLGMMAGMTPVRANEALDDLAGRIEYAFYAGDSRSLQQSWQQLNKLQVGPTDSARRDSYLNYGRWKAAQLLVTDNPVQAQQFAQDCAQSRTGAKDAATLASHHAVVAACYGMLEVLRPVRGALYRGDRDTALSQALKTAGQNPQVLFVAAWLELQRDASDKAHALLTRAMKSFDTTQSKGDAVTSGWGYGETCYLLGKLELARGNALAARNALEQALLQAPDYRDAQQLLQSLSLK